MYNAEYSPVIGWENRISWRFGLGPHKSAIFPANHRAVFCVVHQTTEFRQTTVVDPSHMTKWLGPTSYHNFAISSNDLEAG